MANRTRDLPDKLEPKPDKPLADALAVRRMTIKNILPVVMMDTIEAVRQINEGHSGLGAAQADVKNWEDV